MDAHQPRLQPCAPRMPTGVPNGVDEARRSIRSRRQTPQVPQRRGDEDQTPMFPHGFGTAPAIVVEAQGPLTVLIKRFRWPPLATTDRGCSPRSSPPDA
jgi:hypothetical protein